MKDCSERVFLCSAIVVVLCVFYMSSPAAIITKYLQNEDLIFEKIMKLYKTCPCDNNIQAFYLFLLSFVGT